jgi:hypothetical protein
MLPVASGVVLRLRRWRRPSAAPKVVSKGRHTSAGRSVDMADFPNPAGSDMPAKHDAPGCG